MADDDFAGQVAIVTGGASGIGKALAIALAQRRARVVIADNDGQRATEVADQIGQAASAVSLNVTDGAAFGAVVDTVVAQHRRLDLLINSAGTAVGGEVQDLSLDHWNHVLDVNLKGVIHGVHAAYPAMVKQRTGHIVNLASVAGLGPGPLLTPYATSKWGVVGLSLSLRAEAAHYGVGVTAVCPGVIETPLLERATPDGLPTPPSAPITRSWVSRDLGRPYPADAFALDVLRAIKRNRPVLTAPKRARQAAVLLRLFPAVAGRLAQRRVAQERARRQSTAS